MACRPPGASHQTPGEGQSERPLRSGNRDPQATHQMAYWFASAMFWAPPLCCANGSRQRSTFRSRAFTWLRRALAIPFGRGLLSGWQLFSGRVRTPKPVWAKCYGVDLAKTGVLLNWSRARLALSITIALGLIVGLALTYWTARLATATAELAQTLLHAAQSLPPALRASEQRQAGDPATAVALTLASIADPTGHVQPHAPFVESELDASLRDLHERLLLAHSDTVLAARFSSDGTLILTASADGMARIWSAATGSLTRTIPVGGTINSAAFSPDGAAVATGSDDRQAHLWDVATGKELKSFEGHGAAVNDVAFSADGKQLVTASADATACVWNIADRKRRCTPPDADQRSVLSAALSPDGKLLVTGSAGGRVEVWNAATAARQRANVTGVGRKRERPFVPQHRELLA
jgi:hypothetical protein